MGVGDGTDAERGGLIADHLASFSHGLTGEPEDGVIADGEGDEFVDEIPGEVATLEVGELMRKDDLKIFFGDFRSCLREAG